MSEHFGRVEFEHDGVMADDCVPTWEFFCENVLEPLRAFAGFPLLITSGNRPSVFNAVAHGQPDSEHIYSADCCAADLWTPDRPTRELFDWARNNSTLPYHQLILEHGANGSSVLHVSYNRTKPGVRSVLEGATHNSEPYVAVDHVPYVPDGAVSA